MGVIFVDRDHVIERAHELGISPDCPALESEESISRLVEWISEQGQWIAARLGYKLFDQCLFGGYWVQKARRRARAHFDNRRIKR